jgi:hypothetical protein
MSLRTELNQADPDRLANVFTELQMGELINTLIAGLATAGYTETAQAVTSNVRTLNAIPSALFQVTATTAHTTGVKQILKGAVSGPAAIVPGIGYCVWDGGNKILFNTVDAVTACSVLYAQATDTTASILQRVAGQNP